MDRIPQRGKLIVIDGADAAGKETTTKLLVEKINSLGVLGEKKAYFFTFPDYAGPFGSILEEFYLNGRIGKLGEVNPLVPSIMYAADRALSANKMQSILQRGNWIICDRYVQSNFAYQGVRLEKGRERDNFISILQEMEYGHLNLPKPDKIIILSLSNNIRFVRSSERGDEDIHEKDKDYMMLVAEEYHRLAEKFGWHVVDCAPEGKQLSPDAVADLVWQEIFKEQETVLNNGA